jgi:eukaryotic-like serine/threonine-protein kinase
VWIQRNQSLVQTFKTGELVEGYRVLSEIGRGAASVVYLVQDPKTKQIWALKHVDRGDAKDNRFLEQAEHEYTVARQLDHPTLRKAINLIKIREGFLSSPHELIVVFELVDGTSVDREPPRTIEQCADIFEQVARGLHYMHQKGFVHADMKPNNIIVDAGGVAKIIDLGQSCPVNTVKKRIQGTPDYIAPEQVHRRPITPKTDVYNLGATIYWALTRKFVPTALGKENSLLGTIDESVMPKPTPCNQLNTRVPEYFNQLIMQCVEVEPAMRPESMIEVADRLNMIKARLLSEAELRKSGSFRPVHEEGEDRKARSRSGSRGGSSAAGIPLAADGDPGLRIEDDEASPGHRATA